MLVFISTIQPPLSDGFMTVLLFVDKIFNAGMSLLCNVDSSEFVILPAKATCKKPFSNSTWSD